MPAIRTKPSCRALCSISLIVVLERPKVLPISIKRLCAPFNVNLWDFRLSRTLPPWCNKSSMPWAALCRLLLCCTVWSIRMSTWSLEVNFLANKASRSASSLCRLITRLHHEFKAALRWRLSYFNWSTRILAFCLWDTGPFRHSTSSRSQLLNRKKKQWMNQMYYFIFSNNIYNHTNTLKENNI